MLPVDDVLPAKASPVHKALPMTRTGYFLRLAFSVVIDLFDFTLGRVPVFGSVTEGVGTIVLVAMWGPAGLVNLWELLDFTDQADSFIPTATLVALYVGWREGHLFGSGVTHTHPAAAANHPPSLE